MGCERGIREMDGCGFGVNLILWYKSHVAAFSVSFLALH